MNILTEQDLPSAKEKRGSHFIWVEKYRPCDLTEYICSVDLKTKIQQCIDSKQIGNLLLSGPPGTGKTSLAKLLVSEIACDSLYINASDERKIDDIRFKVRDFAATIGFSDLKIIILDEADNITVDGQKALRNIMETYAEHTRFILTCNYIEKILTPLISRCQVFEIIPPEKRDIAKHVAFILGKESITFKPEDVVTIVKAYYPDVRKIINYTQQSIVAGDLVVTSSSLLDSDIKSKVLDLLKTGKKNSFTNIRQVLADHHIIKFDEFYKNLYLNVNQLTNDVGQTAEIILTIAEAQSTSAFVSNQEINFMACIIKLLRILDNK